MDFDIRARRHARPRPGGGGGYGGSAPGLPAGPGGNFLPVTETIPPPELYLPPSGQSLAAQGSALGVTSAMGWVTLGTFQVPTGNLAVVRMVTISAAPWTLTSSVQWRVVLAGNPAPGWEAITIPLAPAAAIARELSPDVVLIRVPDGSLISAQVRVVPPDLGLYQLAAELRGWYWGVAG